MSANKKRKILVIVGTRPEAIKLAPVILGLHKHPNFEPSVLVTGQHREMLDQVLEVFNITPDDDLDLMENNQSLSSLSAKAITSLNDYFKKHNVDMVLVQGDTTTVFVASLVAFYNKIKVGHIEAGLRTQNKFSPFPEEINRRLVTHLVDYHFTPTETSKNNLLREGIRRDRIFVTGNTVIDALKIAVNKIKASPPEVSGIPNCLLNSKVNKPLLLITAHRRENFGSGIESICHAINLLANQYKDVNFIYPVHLNPNVKTTVFRILDDRKNIYLIKPLSYLPFVYLMERSKIILTDSGGLQEEAPTLGKPVLVMRDTTERPEAIKAGTAKLVGTDYRKIFKETSKLLDNPEYYKRIANATNPYGDGKASERILKALINNS